MANHELLATPPFPSTRVRRGTVRLLLLALLAPLMATAASPRDSLPAESRIPRNRDPAAQNVPPPAVPAAPAGRPHILYVTADDLGRSDVGYQGSSIRTPTLDRLAKEGARLDQFYVQLFVSQTRAAALTGRYPMRYGLQTLQIQWFSEYALPEDEELLPKMLQEAGYRTVLLGKWHLGQMRKEDRPNARGYDLFYGHLGGALDQDKKTDAGGRPDWWRNDKRVKEHGYATTLLAREAAAVIAKHDRAQPLFLHLSLTAPQAPLSATKPYSDYYTGGDAQLRTYRAMVSAVDGAVDQTLKALDKRGMLKDTLVIFHAGSGGAVKRKHPIGDGEPAMNVASNSPYKGGSGGLHEGGVRALAVIWWPGQVQRRVVTDLLHVVDLYPTLLRLAQAVPRQTKPLDGQDVWDTLSQGKESPRKEVLLSVDEFRGALRVEDWKLIQYVTLPSKVELYNLRADPSESDNVAEREPERLHAMQKRLNEFAWEMAPSKYLEELANPRKVRAPIYWDENPVRP